MLPEMCPGCTQRSQRGFSLVCILAKYGLRLRWNNTEFSLSLLFSSLHFTPSTIVWLLYLFSLLCLVPLSVPLAWWDQLSCSGPFSEAPEGPGRCESIVMGHSHLSWGTFTQPPEGDNMCWFKRRAQLSQARVTLPATLPSRYTHACPDTHFYEPPSPLQTHTHGLATKPVPTAHKLDILSTCGSLKQRPLPFEY